jgi:hypothetical protein
MIGTIDEGLFQQGISLFPVLDSPVLITTREDLDTIFGKRADAGTSAEEPGFCIPIGRSALFQDYEIMIDPDAFFGKHAAIIGSTGSGKSCSIATILQSVIEHPTVKQTRFIILDTNGEYRTAFQKLNENGSWSDARPSFKSLYIPTDPLDKNERLAIPYWFMDSDDFVRLFRAAPNVQRPVLLHALSSAREDSKGPSWISLRENLLLECHKLTSAVGSGLWQDKNSIAKICDGVIRSLEAGENTETIEGLIQNFPSLTAESIKAIFQDVRRIAGRKNDKDFDPIAMDVRQKVNNIINSLLAILVTIPQSASRLISYSADCPRYFGKHEFRYKHLDNAMSREEISSSRARENCSTMLMRIYRLLEDSRFEFLFGPTCAEWPPISHSLATFLRDILGAGAVPVQKLNGENKCPKGQLPFYDRQRGASRSNVVIIDLSLLASEVLENVTALIGRLIHEFLQRLTDPISGIGRGEYPVVLVLEEAQNYIRESRTGEDSISKLVFERLAREGRKFGLGLVVASQRPSELSKTVLSQCNSFIVHRLQNPEDLRYFREIVPGIYGQLLDQLPALAPRSALVLGECVQAPALVEMREVSPVPKSKNPKFYKSWTQAENQPDFEAVCAKWEGNQPNCSVSDDQTEASQEDSGDPE